MKGIPATPVDCITARKLLSPKGDPERPLGTTRFSAIKRAMGITSRHVLVPDIIEWLAAHPEFSEKDVYKRRGGVGKKVFKVGGVIPLRHGRWVYKFRITALGVDGKPTQLSLIDA